MFSAIIPILTIDPWESDITSPPDKKYSALFVDVSFGCNILTFAVMSYVANGYLTINAFDGTETVTPVTGRPRGAECSPR